MIPTGQVITQDKWHTISKIIDILKPFKTDQKYSEDKKYVTVSWVPHMLKNIFNKLQESLHLASDEDDPNQHLKSLLEKLFFGFQKEVDFK